MYIHAGNGKMIRTREIVGIYDMDTATMTAATREMLRIAERQGRMETICDDIPKSVIVMKDGKIYVSQLSVSALCGRAESLLGGEWRYAKQVTKVYDLNPLIETHPAFAVMAQSESMDDLLSDVAVDVGGYGIICNDELDLSCDELWSNGK